MKNLTIFGWVLIFCAYGLYAQPTTITWQGKLLDNSGNAITQNNVAMTFAMFDASTGGNQLWPSSGVVTKTVDVNQGLYSVQLGTGIGDDIAFTATMFNGKTPWLEVKVGTATLPRTEITNVPFALISNELSASGWEKPGEIGNTTPNTGKFTSVETENMKITTGASDGYILTSDADGNAGWTTPEEYPWTVTGSNIYYNAGNVGIGTSTPSQKLNVNGSVLIPSGQSYWIGNASDAGNRLRLHHSGTSAYIDWGEDDLHFRSGITSTNDRVLITGDGKVGIGTTAPKAILDLGNSVSNRKINLYTAADNDHQFTGFGLNNDALRFQLANTTGNFKFYGATSATTSTELFRIQGNGQIVIPAMTTAGVLINSASGLISSSVGTSGQVLTTNSSGGINWSTVVTTECDPVFSASVSHAIDAADTTRWGTRNWKKSGSNIYYATGKVGIGSSDPSTLNIAPLNVEGGIRYVGGLSGTGVAGQLYYDPANDGTFKYIDNTGATKVLGTGTISYTGTLWQEENGDYLSNNDVIVHSNMALGSNAVSGQTFGKTTLNLQDDDIRIKFDDTSTGGFPANDWQITANADTDGGDSYFAIDDLTGTKTPFKIMAGAPENSLFISSNGRLGLKTGNPVTEIHMKDNNTPAIRFEQDNSTGWGEQIWDVAANESNFYICNITHGSTLPFRIMPEAPTNSLTIQNNGNVGFGTSSPLRNLHLTGAMRMNGITEPELPAAGDIYYDAGLNKLRYHNGTDWQSLSTPPTLPRLWSYTNSTFYSEKFINVICGSSLGVGSDAIPGLNFGAATIVLKENNLRILFDDTSNDPFPNTDWQLTANATSSGGDHFFAIDDVTHAKTPFKVMAEAPTNSIFIDKYGRLGLKTGTPFTEIHMKDSDTPTVRFEQDNSSGWTAQIWDVAGNETNFFIRDVTGGSNLSFRIKPGAPTNSLTIIDNGNVGIGTWTPQQKLHIMGIMRLEPTDEPATAGEGDIYYDKNTHKARCFDGTQWNDLW